MGDEMAALHQFQPHIHAGGVLLGQFVAEAGEHIPPCLDHELVTPDTPQREARGPPVVGHGLHPHLVPRLLIGLAPLQHRTELVMPVAQQVAGDGHHLAGPALGREMPMFDGG